MRGEVKGREYIHGRAKSIFAQQQNCMERGGGRLDLNVWMGHPDDVLPTQLDSGRSGISASGKNLFKRLPVGRFRRENLS